MSCSVPTPRELARALAEVEVPTLSKVEVHRRWRISDKTVTTILRAAQIAPAPSFGKRDRFSILDLLRIEGVTDPEVLWAYSSDEQRQELLAPLLKVSDVIPLINWQKLPPAGTVRRWADEGTIPAIKLGGQWRFRASELPVGRKVRAK